MIIIVLSLILLLLDQISKYLILNYMTIGESLPVIDNFFYITSHRNRGAAWGILQDSRYFFIIVTIILFLALIYYIKKNHSKLTFFDKITFALIFGGGLGNFIDRVKSGEVIDFLDFNLFGYAYPIFNLADIFICIGVFLFMIKIYKEE